jgi:hypothetical protein
MAKRRLQPTAAIPVVEQIPVTLETAERERLKALAGRLLADEPALNATAAFGAAVAPGCRPGPAVLIEDHSTITLFSRTQLSIYDYRALMLAGQGDTLVIGTARNEVFEDYCRSCLGLGDAAIEVTAASSPQAGGSLALAAAEDPPLVARLAARARQGGGLTLVPYMGTGGVWRLAARLAAEARQPVRVAAPPPRLVRRVNDKTWFAARVAEVLGPQAAPPSEAVFGHAALAQRLARYARSHPSVAVKVADSASSVGNLVFDAAELSELTLRRLSEELRDRLAAVGWPGTFPLMVTAWERPVIASPSVQLWIPAADEGTPVVEGIFDQMVTGRQAAFAGAQPSTLPPALQQRAAIQAVRLASLFQALGYFGRCSFDAVVVGVEQATAQLHWVECNGRWGGVSIPMTLANRLSGDWSTSPPVILDCVVTGGRPRPFAQILAELEGDLYRAGGPARGAIFLSPGRIERGAGFHALVPDASLPAARRRAERLEERLRELLSTPEAAARIA